jgi:hypothetical protein
VPSISELQSAVTQSLEAAVDSMRFASELMAKNTAQQQEIERLRGENAELLQENVRLLTPTHDEFRQLLAAQRKGERAVDVESLADELAACEWPQDNWPVSHAALASNMKPILRRHLEPQGEPNERDEVPVSQELPSVQPERQVSAGDVAGQAVPDEAEQRLAMAQGRNREGDSTRYPAPQAVAPASPVRAEEKEATYREEQRESRLIAAYAALESLCDSAANGYDDKQPYLSAREDVYDGFILLQAELAALRKQVVEARSALGSIRTIASVEILDIDDATPEPKEPA